MGSGGSRGLQNRCFGAEASKGWFDSDAPPPASRHAALLLQFDLAEHVGSFGAEDPGQENGVRALRARQSVSMAILVK